MTTDLTGAATSVAHPPRGWRRLLSLLDAGTAAAAPDGRLAELRARETARALGLRRYAEQLASVPSLADRLRRLADRAEAAAQQLREAGATVEPAPGGRAAAPGPAPSAPPPTPWAGLRRQAEEAGELAERYLDLATALEREQPALAAMLTARRAACAAEREELLRLLATWDPVVLERLASASAGAAAVSPALP